MKKRERIEERYQKNLKSLPDERGYIFSQNSSRYRELLFGDKGNVGANGCAAVAVHNVMKHIGKARNFCDVLRDMETLCLPWLGGRFGTKPWALGKYFYKKKVPYQKLSSPNDFKAALLKRPVGIVCTWNKRFYGMHFYCVYFDKEEQRYYAANFRSNGKEFREIALDEISNLRFVVGYMIL